MPELHPGLKGVYLGKSAASFIDGDQGRLYYRGYSIHELAEYSTFEETAFLLLHGHLPTRAELERFDYELKQARLIPENVIEVIRQVQRSHPMDVLRTAMSALSSVDPDVNDMSPEASLRKGIRMTAQAPTIVAAHARIREGKQPVAPSRSLGHAANFLYMLFDKQPTEEEARLIDVDLILHAEHGSNASSFASRVTASTNADIHCAIVSAIGTLKGPAHGGAAEAVMKMAQEIGKPERAQEYVRERISTGGKIMGFGHRVYRAEDPRARHLRDRASALATKKGDPHWFQILQEIEKVMEQYASRGICVNVDFFAGVIYYLLGIPEDLFVPMFAIGRVPGWVLQALEQYDENMLIRPLMEYEGELDRQYIQIGERG